MSNPPPQPPVTSSTLTESTLLKSPRAEERVPLRSKLAWALGSLGDNYIMNSLNTLVNPIYNVGLGMRADLIGWALFFPRFLDAFVDPLVGYLSDNTRSHWGRRRPFILASALPMAIVAVLMWMPPARASQTGLFWYFLIVSMCYYIAYSFFIVPYRALGLELSTDYNERTRVQAWGMIIGLLGGLGIPWLYKLSIIVGGGQPGETSVAADVILSGVKWVGLGVALLILLTCAAPALFCRETESTTSGQKISLREAFVQTLRNRAFLYMLLMNLITIVATVAGGGAILILAIYYLYHGDESAAASLMGWTGMATLLGAFSGIPMNTWVSTKIGKRGAAIFCLATTLVGFASYLWSLKPGFETHLTLPALGDVSFHALIFSNLLIGIGLQGVWLMTATMNADVCDEDERQTGLRREGLYGAIFALEQKVGLALAALAGGYLLHFCGYVEKSIPDPAVLERLRYGVIVMPVFGLILAMLAASRYPLTQARIAAIRCELDARKHS